MSSNFQSAGLAHYTLDPPGTRMFCRFWTSSCATKPPEVTQFSNDDKKLWNDDVVFNPNVTTADWEEHKSRDLRKWIDPEVVEKISFVVVVVKMKACVYAQNLENAGGSVELAANGDVLCLAQVLALPSYPKGFAQREDIKYARVTLPIEGDFTFKFKLFNQISEGQPNYTTISCWLAGFYTQS
jgi:hypothetical protein